MRHRKGMVIALCILLCPGGSRMLTLAFSNENVRKEDRSLQGESPGISRQNETNKTTTTDPSRLPCQPQGAGSCIHRSNISSSSINENGVNITKDLEATIVCPQGADGVGFEPSNDCQCEGARLTVGDNSLGAQRCQCELCGPLDTNFVSLDCTAARRPFVIDNCTGLTCNGECIFPGVTSSSAQPSATPVVTNTSNSKAPSWNPTLRPTTITSNDTNAPSVLLATTTLTSAPSMLAATTAPTIPPSMLPATTANSMLPVTTAPTTAPSMSLETTDPAAPTTAPSTLAAPTRVPTTGPTAEPTNSSNIFDQPTATTAQPTTSSPTPLPSSIQPTSERTLFPTPTSTAINSSSLPHNNDITTSNSTQAPINVTDPAEVTERKERPYENNFFVTFIGALLCTCALLVLLWTTR